MNKKILFLNPPGKKLYIRDYYCSKISKAYYLPQPVDLLMQTGFFSDKKFELMVIDAIAQRLNIKVTLKKIIRFQPDLIVTQCGSSSFEEDTRFFSLLKSSLPLQILNALESFVEFFLFNLFFNLT